MSNFNDFDLDLKASKGSMECTMKSTNWITVSLEYCPTTQKGCTDGSICAITSNDCRTPSIDYPHRSCGRSYSKDGEITPYC